MIELSFCQTYATQEFVRVSQHDFSKKKKPFHLDAMLVSEPGSVHLPRERWLGGESVEPFPFFSFGIDSGDGVSSPSFLLLRSSILSCFFGGVKFCAAMIRFSFLWGASVRPSVRPSIRFTRECTLCRIGHIHLPSQPNRRCCQLGRWCSC